MNTITWWQIISQSAWTTSESYLDILDLENVLSLVTLTTEFAYLHQKSIPLLSIYPNLLVSRHGERVLTHLPQLFRRVRKGGKGGRREHDKTVAEAMVELCCSRGVSNKTATAIHCLSHSLSLIYLLLRLI